MLHCNGKCILAKKLRQERKEQQNPERKLENGVEVFFNSNMAIATPAFSISKTYYLNYADIRLADLSFPVFHPPCNYISI